MIKIYTDGSCLENPGNGGWAAIIINNGQKTNIKGSKKNVGKPVKKDKKNLNKDFWVFTGSSVGVVPIKGKGLYIGKIENLGSVKTIIV